MLNVFPLSEKNMLGFTIDGEIDAAGMRKFMTALEAKVMTHGKVRLLGNIKNLGGWDTFQTFWDTLKANKELWPKVEKYAILTDNVLVEKAGQTVGWLTPDLVLKSFKLSEGEKAHEWLAAPMPERKSEALTLVDLGHDNILGLAVVGVMQPADYEKLDHHIQDKVGQYGKARIFLEIVELKGVSFRAFWEDLKTSIKHYKDVERVAIIGDQGWLKTSVKLGDLLTPGLDLAAFGTKERQRAINWLL